MSFLTKIFGTKSSREIKKISPKERIERPRKICEKEMDLSNLE